MKPTEQQKEVIKQAGILEAFLVMARAGAGKTTTIFEIAKAYPEKQILYLVFNSHNKKEAEQKAKKLGIKNMHIKTSHGLAYGKIVPKMGYEVGNNLAPIDIINQSKKLTKMYKNDRVNTYILASNIVKYYNGFLSSDLHSMNDLDPSLYVMASKDYLSLIQDTAKETWKKMDEKEMPITHDFYLKKYSLMNPVLDYDMILQDEAHDGVPCVLNMFKNQQTTRIAILDENQRIYGWKGAISIFDIIDDWPVFPLTQSFRFHEGIAERANQVLDLQKILLPDYENKYKVIGKGKKPLKESKDATMYLGRTNGSIISKAISEMEDNGKEYLHFVGNVKSYIFGNGSTNIYDVYNLYVNQKARIKDPLVSSMGDFKELSDYANETGDVELSRLISTVERYKKKLPVLIKRLQEYDTRYERAEIGFSTIHRAKGLEWDSVVLMPDVINEEKLLREKTEIDKMTNENDKKRKISELIEEINAYYIGVTRSKNILIEL